MTLCKRLFCTRSCFILEVFNIGKEMLINEQIRAAELRIVDSDGAQLGIMSSKEALDIAVGRELDLVMIAPNATPPVCRIMNYSKYKFEQAKKEKDQRKNQKTVELKEIRLSYNIDVHDFDTKLNQAKKFLASGNKLKVSIRFRGREMAHTALGQERMERFSESLSEIASVDRAPKLEGRNMMMFLTPKPVKPEKAKAKQDSAQ